MGPLPEAGEASVDRAVRTAARAFPILLIVALSFGSSQWLIFPPPSWTTKWYAELFADPRWTGPPSPR